VDIPTSLGFWQASDTRSGGGRFETDSTVWTFLVRARRE
jgi:hypothetical protein